MISRQLLGWGALIALGIGAAILGLLWAAGVPLDRTLIVGLGAAAVAAVLATFAGTLAWHTRPGKAAVIGGILLAVAVIAFAGLAYLLWAVMRGLG
jgi:hypothetical protein